MQLIKHIHTKKTKTMSTLYKKYKKIIEQNRSKSCN